MSEACLSPLKHTAHTAHSTQPLLFPSVCFADPHIGVKLSEQQKLIRTWLGQGSSAQVPTEGLAEQWMVASLPKVMLLARMTAAVQLRHPRLGVQVCEMEHLAAQGLTQDADAACTHSLQLQQGVPAFDRDVCIRAT